MSYYPDIPDHPDIQRMERDGTLDPDEDEIPVCPVCYEECDTAYFDKDGEPLGCENCICKKDAWDDIRYLPKAYARQNR